MVTCYQGIRDHSNDLKFATTIGFTEEDIHSLVNHKITGEVLREQLIQRILRDCWSESFAEGAEKVYNSKEVMSYNIRNV
ncbi:hypothetical protein GYMLUDRAFT_725520 [Collybiopsis luxurians FD-317 M1]|nr:hypothetical protein GYMLUDRAFT_725520 [Collybiopsis luxurians FD-317 M1]